MNKEMKRMARRIDLMIQEKENIQNVLEAKLKERISIWKREK
jgi:hypothetical protein